VLLGLMLLSVAGCDDTTPSPIVAIQVTASPSQVSGAVCTGCGAGSTDREVATAIAIQETGGAPATVVSIEMSLTDSGTNAVIASGTFDTAAVQQLADSARLPGNGRLSVPISMHYAADLGGRAGSWRVTVTVRDDRGNDTSGTLTIPVTST
jgi:hypothetical protein